MLVWNVHEEHQSIEAWRLKANKANCLHHNTALIFIIFLCNHLILPMQYSECRPHFLIQVFLVFHKVLHSLKDFQMVLNYTLRKVNALENGLNTNYCLFYKPLFTGRHNHSLTVTTLAETCMNLTAAEWPSHLPFYLANMDTDVHLTRISGMVFRLEPEPDFVNDHSYS